MSTSARSPLRWWDLGVAGVLIVMAALAAVEALSGAPAWAQAQPTAVRVVLIALPAVAFALLHLLLGRPVLRHAMAEQPPEAPAIVFLALAVAVLAYGTFTVPLYAVLQTLVYPMAWSIVARYAHAVAWSGAIALATGLSMFAGIAVGGGGMGNALGSAAITASLSFAFAVVMGTWITRIATEGERHRALAEQLRASQAEVAALSADAGAAAERERLSRDLHDTLTQTLAGLVMLSEQAERALDAGDAPRARDRLGRVGAAAREAVAEARALVATTQPLGDGGLEAAIERVARRIAADAGLRVDCALEQLSLDRERQVVLLRAAQEGLANARRHAKATWVGVELRASADGGAVLRVDDDGTGPDAEAMSRGGFGLSGLADRVRAVSGAVTFEARPGGGSRLEVQVAAASTPDRAGEDAAAGRASAVRGERGTA